MNETVKEILTYIILIIIVLIIAQHLNVVVSGSTVKEGDIVVYDAVWYDNPVIHRIIDIKDINGTTMYMIKGDNNGSPDPYWVKAEQITGRVVTLGEMPVIIPKIGYLSLWIRGL